MSDASCLDLLRSYALFLEQYHLRELSHQYLHLVNQLSLSQLHQWKKYSTEEQLQLIQRGFKVYLQQLAAGRLPHGFIDIIEQWKTNTLFLPSKKIELSDLDNLYRLAKQLLLQYLPQYSSSPEAITGIVLEIDKLYTAIQHYQMQFMAETFQGRKFREGGKNKHTEEELRKSKALLQEAQQVAHLGSWEWDLTRDLITWSDETYRIFGLEPGEMPVDLDLFLNFIHPEDRPKYQLALDNAVQHGIPYQLQHKIIGRDKVTRWLLSTGLAVQDASGAVLRITGTGLDITDQKLVEEALQLSEKKFRTLFEKSGDAILLMTSQGFIDCNLAAVKMLGASSQEEILMLHPVEISPQEQPDKLNSYSKLQEYISKAIEDGGCRFEWLCRKINYEEFWVEVLFTPIPLEGKTVIYAVLRDISLRKEAEKELENKNIALKIAYKELKDAQGKLQQVNNELEERVKLRTQEILLKNYELNHTNQELNRINVDLDNFIYTASHDLKAPVSNLEGLTSQLKEKLFNKLNDTETIMMEMVIASINKLKATIADLTEISRVQKETDEAKEPIAFADILEEITGDIQSLIDESNALITTNWEVPEIIYARKNLRSILYNLISNAIKYRAAERKPEIIIHTWQETDHIVMSVTDNGLGIQEAQSHKLFKMFKRIYSHVEGSGIGLYIVKRIIENNGGEIQVQSKPDQGSTFTVYFKSNTVTPVS